jgi:UDP-GlcNAc:undecaprenyl-phosphate GlcNAc-1-phosphate transferase
MYLGVAAAILVATRLPALQRTFDDSQTSPCSSPAG